MNKKLIGCLIAASVAMATVLPGSVAFADTTQPATSAGQSQSAPQATQPSQSSPSTTSNSSTSVTSSSNSSQSKTDGPVITTTYQHFLILQGSNFNTATDLGLKVTDPYDQDLASKIQVKPISTAKCLKYTMELNVTDTHGKSAEDTITINVIGIKPSISLNSASDLSKADLLSLVEGNTQGLKATASNVNTQAGTFTLNVTNGEETVSKTVKMDISKLPSVNPAVVVPQTDKQGNKVAALPVNQTSSTTANSSSKPASSNTASTPATSQANGSSSVTAQAQPQSASKIEKPGLPKTESVAFAGFAGIAGISVAGGVLYLIKSKFRI